MKEYWLPKNQCAACNACYNICPVNAISMLEDDCGFKYPSINENCMNCNLCEKICNDERLFLLLINPRYMLRGLSLKNKSYNSSPKTAS